MFDDPRSGSIIDNKETTAKTWLRQEGEVFFLGLWVGLNLTFGKQGAGMTAEQDDAGYDWGDPVGYNVPK